MKNLVLRILELVIPYRLFLWFRTQIQGDAYEPAVGKIDFGDLGRLEPLCNDWGLKRGGAVDRYYIDGFIVRNSHDIKGNVLEIEDGYYGKKLGSDKMTQLDILDIDPNNPMATIIADLTQADDIPSNTYDCIILTQVLQLIYDLKSVVKHVHRILKPGGVLLVTVPGISQVVYKDYRNVWCWSFTEVSVRKLLTEYFLDENVEIERHGNVLTAISFLHGVGIKELTKKAYDFHDPDYQLVITAKAVKQCTGQISGHV